MPPSRYRPTKFPPITGESGKILSTDGRKLNWILVPSGIPDQTGQAGKYLTTDGISASWVAATLNAQAASVGNVGSGEDDLHTYTIPANTLITTGRGIRWEGFGGVAENSNNKTLRIYFGAQLVSVAIPISTAVRWVGEAKIIRTGLNAQRYMVRIDIINVTTNALIGTYVASGTLTQTETSAIVIKATGEAAIDNEITQAVSVVSYF